MGRVAGSYGVRGWVKVAPDDGAEESLASAREWWIGTEAYAVSGARIHGATVVGKLAGLESREQVLALKGRTVALRRDALPEAEQGKYYLADLVGLEVVNEQGVTLGTVKSWTFNGAQDVMEVAGDRARLIPWIPSVIKAVDLAKRRIDVDWGADW